MRRTQNEDWVEWTPTFGMRWKVAGVGVQYNWRVTCATDCFPMMGDKVNVAAPTVGVIAAPTRKVNVDGGTAHVHQIVVSVPIR